MRMGRLKLSVKRGDGGKKSSDTICADIPCERSPKDPYGNNNQHYGRRNDGHDAATVPTFDLSESGDVTAVLNKPAILNCRVKSIGNKTVSCGHSSIMPMMYSFRSS